MSAVCDVLRISRAGFYAWRSEEESARAQRDRRLLSLVREEFRSGEAASLASVVR